MYKINKRHMLISFAIASFVLIELLFFGNWAFSSVDEFIIKPKYGQFFVDLVNNTRKHKIEEQGWSFWNMSIIGGEARYIFKHKTSNAEVVIFLSHPSNCNKPVGKSETSFCLTFEQYPHPHRNHHQNATVLFEFITYGIENNINPFKWAKLSSKKSPLLNKELIQFVLIFPLFLFLIVSGAITVINQLRKSTNVSIQMLLLIIVTAGAFLLRLSAKRFLCDVWSAADMGFVIGPSHQWSAGYSVYLHFLFWLFSQSYEIIYLANIIVGTSSVLLLYVFVKIYLKDDIAAFASAAVLAFLPIHAKFSASDSPHILLTFSYFSSLCFLCLWAKEGRLWFLIQGLGWLVLSFNIRSESLVYLISTVFVIIGCFRNYSFGKLVQVILASFLGSIFSIKPLLDLIEQVPAGRDAINLDGFKVNPFFCGEDSPTPLRIIAICGILMMILLPSLIFLKHFIISIIEKDKISQISSLKSKWLEKSRVGICLLFAIYPIALPTLFDNIATNNTDYRYFLPLLVMYSIFAGYGLKNISFLFKRFPLLRLSMIFAIALVSSLPWWGFIKKTWTHEIEFEFIRKNMKLINNGCTVVTANKFSCSTGLHISPYISVEAGLKHRWIETQNFLSNGVINGCAIYYQSAACFSRTFGILPCDYDELPECKKMREKFTLIPIAKDFLPVLPYVGETYTRNPIPVGFYIVKTKTSKKKSSNFSKQ